MPVDTLSPASATTAGRDERDPFEACATAAGGALSANTERAMRSDLALYAAWCEERGVPALPARAETVAAFVDAMAKLRAPATVRRYVASIAAAHRAVGSGKTARSEAVRRALQRMHRRKGRRQEQARGLTGALRERLLAVPGDGLIDARNRALLAVAYDTLLRRGELVALQVMDIIEELGRVRNRAGAPFQGRPRGPKGATVYLARDSLALVREWLAQSGVCRGRVFRSLCRGAVGEGLDASQVPRIFKAMAERAGLPVGSRLSASPGTAPGSVRRRTWSRAASAWRPSCTRADGRRQRWSTATARASLRGEAARRSSPVFSIASRRGAAAYRSAFPARCAGVRPPESVQGAGSHGKVIAGQQGRPPGRRLSAAPGARCALRRKKRPLNQQVTVRYGATADCGGIVRGGCPVAGCRRRIGNRLAITPVIESRSGPSDRNPSHLKAAPSDCFHVHFHVLRGRSGPHGPPTASCAATPPRRLDPPGVRRAHFPALTVRRVADASHLVACASCHGVRR